MRLVTPPKRGIPARVVRSTRAGVRILHERSLPRTCRRPLARLSFFLHEVQVFFQERLKCINMTIYSVFTKVVQTGLL